MARILLTAVIAAAFGGCSLGDQADDSPDRSPEHAEPPFSTSDWRTDFSQHSVPLEDFTAGGPPKDGIPSIDDPKLVPVAEADAFLADRERIEFGTTGMLRSSDLVMYDRATESWWQQLTADAVVGELTGFDRDYGTNPYASYDTDPDSTPFIFDGPLRGTRLAQVPHDDRFWFAVAAFFDDAQIER